MKSLIRPLMIGIGILVLSCTHSGSSDDEVRAPDSRHSGSLDDGVEGPESRCDSCRVLPIPLREGSYRRFKTTIVSSEEELREFLGPVKEQQLKYQDEFKGVKLSNQINMERFLNVLEAADIDFASELLVLLRHAEGSGSIRVSLAAPVKRGAQLEYRMIRKAPKAQTADEAAYCFALVVPKEIETLLVKADGLQERLVSLR